MKPDTLVRKLGTTTHLSPPLMKARRLGLRGVGDLERLAVESKDDVDAELTHLMGVMGR